MIELNYKRVSTKLSVYIITVTATLFIISFVLDYVYTSRVILDEAFEKSELQVKNIALAVDGITSEVQTFVEKLKPLVEDRLNANIETNQQIYSRDSHSNRDAETFRNLFELYIVDNKSGVIRHLSLDKNSQNYITTSAKKADGEIIKQRLSIEKSCWSEPYVSNFRDGKYIITYSTILKDEEGEVRGILAADIPLTRFKDLAIAVKPYPQSYVYILSAKGRYIAHRDSNRVVKTDFFSANASMNDSAVIELGHNMLSGKSGMSSYVLNGVECYEFYCPAQDAGWSVGMVTKKDDITKELVDSIRVLIAIVVLGLLLLFFVVIYVIRLSTNKLNELSLVTKEIAKGNFNTPLPVVQGRDEIYELKESFSTMQSSLKEYIEELKIKTQIEAKTKSELNIASKIQMGMLPIAFPPYKGAELIELYATLTPAKGVGGDLYDFFVQDDTFWFTIGDVSGKGVPASIFMAVTSTSFRSAVKSISEPAMVLASMNSSIVERGNTDMFTTLFVGALNTKTNTLRYANAGHNPPIILSGSKVEFIKQDPNLPLGILPNFKYSEHSIELRAGDSLILYTDGLNEAENLEQELYSNARLMDSLNRRAKDLDSRQLSNYILSQLKLFTLDCPQSDDLALMIIKVDGERYAEEEIVIENKISELALVEIFAENICRKYKIGIPLQTTINLILEELLSNTILYGYPQAKRDKIRIRFEKGDTYIKLTITDSAIEFDPTAAKSPDINLSADERAIGGLGVHIVRKMSDKMEYKRENNTNILIIKKLLTI